MVGIPTIGLFFARLGLLQPLFGGFFAYGDALRRWDNPMDDGGRCGRQPPKVWKVGKCESRR